MIEPAGERVRANTNRKVWVINNWTKPHVEEFRGEKITIPPNGEKKVLMPFLKARRFLGQTWPLFDPLPDGSYREGEAPKMLKVVELTHEDRLRLEGITPEEAKKIALEEEKALRLRCSYCGFQAVSDKGLKIHMSKNHEGVEPVETPMAMGSARKEYPEEEFARSIKEGM